MAAEYGRIYENPDNMLGSFEVVKTSFAALDSWSWARLNQDIINQVLTDQLSHSFTAKEVKRIADPRDPIKVAEQERKLELGLKTGQAIFVHCKLHNSWFEGEYLTEIVGIGKTQYADGRLAAAKRARPNPPATNNVADIRGLYVLPRAGSYKLQGQGYGSAMLHFMLNQYPDLMPTLAIDFSEANHKLQPLIKGLGFEAVRERPAWLGGIETPQTVYKGPNCGNLIAMLEDAHPWLTNSQVIPEPC